LDLRKLDDIEESRHEPGVYEDEAGTD
jgi:hypothetical protein